MVFSDIFMETVILSFPLRDMNKLHHDFLLFSPLAICSQLRRYHSPDVISQPNRMHDRDLHAFYWLGTNICTLAVDHHLFASVTQLRVTGQIVTLAADILFPQFLPTLTVTYPQRRFAHTPDNSPF